MRGRRRIQSNENATKSERRRLTKTISNESSNAASSFDYLFSNEQQLATSSSNDVFSSSTSSQQSFTSVRDMNKNLYNLLQSHSQDQSYSSSSSSSTIPGPNILHDMLKSSPPSTSNTNEHHFNSGTCSRRFTRRERKVGSSVQEWTVHIHLFRNLRR